VQPPFAAPPTDGTRQRRWLAIGLAGGVALVLCVGGLVGLGGVVVLSTQVLRDESVTAVTEYLTAIQDERYSEAYDQLCESVQRQTPRSTFVREQSRRGIVRFTVGEAQLADAIRVPATINYDDRTVSQVQFVMEQDTQTGAVEVCGQED
jgi:nucleoside phosphorylase